MISFEDKPPTAPNHAKVYVLVTKHEKVEKQAHHVVMIDFFGLTDDQVVRGIAVRLTANNAISGEWALKFGFEKCRHINTYYVLEVGEVQSEFFDVPHDTLTVTDYHTRCTNAVNLLFKVVTEATKALTRLTDRADTTKWSAEVNCQQFAREFVSNTLHFVYPPDGASMAFPTLQNLFYFLNLSSNIDDSKQASWNSIEGIYDD